MSKNQFDPYKKTTKTKINQSPSKILEDYDKFINMKKGDLKLMEFITEEQYLSDMILKRVQTLHNSEGDTDKIKELNNELSLLDQEHSELKKKKSEYIKINFKWLSETHPEIFEMIIGPEPPARSTLESVINAYIQSERGEIDRKTVVKNSLETMRKQNGLPDDFFDYSKLDQIM